MASRVVRSILIAIIAVYGVYLLAANVILRTHLLRGWLTGDGGSLLVDYGSARSLLPGSVVVHDLRIRQQDSIVQMSVHIDRASVDIDLLALARHVASFRNVKAEGVEYRLRQRLDTLDGNEGRAKAFPLIDGFPESPLASSQPPLSTGDGPDWTIEILDLAATVREVWTLEYHFQGIASLSGGFHLDPAHIAQVSPSTMHTTSGTWSLGAEPLVEGGEWSLAATIDPFVPGEVHGANVLRYISFAVEARGDVVSIAPVGHTYLSEGGGVSIRDGAGGLAVSVRVQNGIVQAGSRVGYQSAKAVVSGGALSVAADVDVVAEVDSTLPNAPHIIATAKSKRGTMVPATELTGVHAELALRGLDTTAPIVIDTLAATLGGARSGDMRAWNSVPELEAADVAFTGGAVSTSARGIYAGGALTGHVDTKLDRVGLRISPFAVTCSGASSTDVKSDDVGDAITLHATRVDLYDVAMKLMDGESRGMVVSARSNDTRIATSGKAMTDTTIAVESGPGEPTMKLFTGMAHIPGVAADIVAGKKLDAQVHLRVRHDDVAIDVVSAKDGIVEGRGRLHKQTGKAPAGAFIVSVAKVSAGIDIAPSGVSIVPLAGGDWLKEKIAKR